MTSTPRSEFSHRTRTYNLARFRAEIFDILVIGGGIMGAGIAREAALRGYKVALVEKEDFGSGATSQSSQLLSFDIGDLETSRFDRLYEVGQEQRRLQPLSPNQISSLPFLLPTYRSDHHDTSLINLGLWMYDGLPIPRGESRHQLLTSEQIRASSPLLDMSDIVGGVRYPVFRASVARLTMETILSAHHNKAVMVNHVQAEEMKRSAGRRIEGVRTRDMLSGEFVDVRARVIVSASGPWTSQVLALDSPQTAAPPLVKSVHLVSQRKRFPISEAVAFRAKSDNPRMFALPMGDFTVFGPREKEYIGSPDKVQAEPEDVEYILRAVADSFSGAQLGLDDVVSTYAELRPAMKSASNKPDGLVHDREMRVSPGGVLVAPGCDLTNHRAKAQNVVSHAEKILLREFGQRASFPSRSTLLPLSEVEGNGKPPTGAQANALESLPTATRAHLEHSYGARQARVLDYALTDNKLWAPIVDGLPYIWAEVPHSVEQEMALTVADLMMRRMDLFHELPDGAVVAAREIARYMSRILDWIDSDIEQEVIKYAEAVRLNRECLRK